MSITIGAAPALLLYDIYMESVLAVTNASNISKEFMKEIKEGNLSYSAIKEMEEKEFQTNFMDNTTLIKTLTEHGGIIESEKLGYIKCKIEEVVLEFYKKGDIETTPYYLKARFDANASIDELVKEINSEYTSNTQEASYNKIIKRLEDKNLQYEEEVCEDDSIVITVNLD